MMKYLLPLLLSLILTVPAYAQTVFPSTPNVTNSSGILAPNNGGTGWGIHMNTGAFARKNWMNYWESGSTTGRNVGSAGTNSFSSVAAFNDSTGSGVTFTSAASTDALAGLATGYIASSRQISPIHCTALKPVELTDVRIIAGLASADSVMTTDSPTTLYGAYFRFNSSLSDTTWKVCVSNNGAPTVYDSLIPVTTDTKYLFIVDCRDPNKIDFWISVNNAAPTLVKSVNTGLPSASQTMRNYCGLSTRVGTAKSVKLYFYGVSTN